MGKRCNNCGFPVEDHPPGIFCDYPHDWRAASLQKQIDQLGLHLQAMKIKVSEAYPPCSTRKTYYLACPYSSDKPSLRWLRQELVSQVAAGMMSKSAVVFSPITQGHHLAEHLPANLAHDHEFWMTQCLPFVEWADVFALLPLEGWRESRGVQKELAYAQSLGKQILVFQLPGLPMCNLFTPKEAEALFGPSTLMEIL